MTTLREAAQLLLTRWDETDPVDRHQHMVDGILALGKALERPEPELEPVAWGLEEITEQQHLGQIVKPHRTERYCVPLYTVPPIEQIAIDKWRRMANIMGEYHKPLTPEQLHEIREYQRLLEQLGPVWAPMLYYFCKAIEKAHGIVDSE